MVNLLRMGERPGLACVQQLTIQLDLGLRDLLRSGIAIWRGTGG